MPSEFAGKPQGLTTISAVLPAPTLQPALDILYLVYT
jgi:hypothetical protein